MSHGYRTVERKAQQPMGITPNAQPTQPASAPDPADNNYTTAHNHPDSAQSATTDAQKTPK